MLRIILETNNNAFVESNNAEIAKILKGLANNFENGCNEPSHGKLRDSNGNVVGSYIFDNN